MKFKSVLDELMSPLNKRISIVITIMWVILILALTSACTITCKAKPSKELMEVNAREIWNKFPDQQKVTNDVYIPKR